MRNLVKWFIGGTFVVWIGFDVWLTQNGGPTESQVLRDLSYQFNILPFVVGFLLSHWFMPKRNIWKSGWMMAVPIMVLIGVLDFIYGSRSDLWFRYPGIWACLGVPAGYFLWPQPPK